MGAMVPPLHWPPEDDVLLKNAVEAGASLESLAKGAVRFSRKYTVRELQDRWYSLLYDPVSVTEASPHMFEVELLGLTNLTKHIKPESAKNSRKRKSDSIRKSYYAMRKRICNDPFDLMSIDLLPDPNGPQGQEFVLGPDPFPEFEPNAAHGNIQFGPDLEIRHKNIIPPNTDLDGIPRFDASQELPIYDLFESKGLLDEENEFRPGPFRNHACSSSTMPQMPMWEVSSDISVPIQLGEQGQQHAQDPFIIPQPDNSAIETDNFLAAISNTLFDDVLFVDNNGKETIDNSYYDGLSSLLLDSPSQAEVGGNGGDLHLPQVELPQVDLPQVDLPQVDLPQVDLPQADLPQVETSPTCDVKVFGPEYTNGVICCTLNTEDPEIPSNEDVFIPFRSEDTSDLMPPPPVKKPPSGRKLAPVAKNKQKVSCEVKPAQPSDKGLKHRAKDQGVKFELPKSNINHAALRNTKSVGEGNPSRINSANTTANRYIGGGGAIRKCGSVEMMDSEKNVDCRPVGVCVDNRQEGGLEVHNNNNNNNNNDNNNNNNKVREEILNVGSMANDEMSRQNANDKAQLSDMEEWSENDVPYFSDVEAMILDMDLTPDESYLYTNPEVTKYRNEESKRAIIRLEQAANACTQRETSSHSALALLRGRCSKHFIKKPEVLLGRSTEDNTVDIDLGREKNGGKISRRQATIKLDTSGVFQLINLGKHPIFVNDKSVLPGQSSSLHSHCFIGVRGLPFEFYINEELVDQYVKSNNGEGRHKPSNGS